MCKSDAEAHEIRRLNEGHFHDQIKELEKKIAAYELLLATLEKHLREQIATEIEIMAKKHDHVDSCAWLREGCDCPLKEAASIARGTE